MTVLDVVKWAFTAGVTISCARYAASGQMKHDFQIFKGLSALDWIKVVVLNLVVLTATLTGIVLAYTYGPTFLQWSWLTLFATQGEQGTNLNLAGASIPYFGIVFMILLILNFPRLARYEDEEFRDGTKNWLDAIPRSIKFGLWHCVVGVPLCAGILLAFPGLWFTRQYFRGGVERSTLYHATYNMILGGALLAYLVLANLHGSH